MEYGIPAYGTMAHSFIQARSNESQAFLNFARSHRWNVVLLIDTYDTEQGAERVVDIAKTLASDEWKLRDVLSKGAPIDGFGIGSRLDVSVDAPYSDCAYTHLENVHCST
jgi:nicotinate phosphoribosyltransferase